MTPPRRHRPPPLALQTTSTARPVRPYVSVAFERDPSVRTVVVDLCACSRMPRAPCRKSLADIVAEGVSPEVLAEIWTGARCFINGNDSAPPRGVLTPIARRVSDGTEGIFRRHDRKRSPRTCQENARFPGVRAVYVARGNSPGQGAIFLHLERCGHPWRNPLNAAVLFVAQGTHGEACAFAAKVIAAFNHFPQQPPIQGARVLCTVADHQGGAQHLQTTAPLIDAASTFALAGVHDCAYVPFDEPPPSPVPSPSSPSLIGTAPVRV